MSERNFVSPAGHEPSVERYKAPHCWACDCGWPCPTVMIATIDALQSENARLREQAEALAEAHQQIRSIILSVENRCMAADGPVLPTLAEMTEAELRKIWQASDAALRAYGEATS